MQKTSQTYCSPDSIRSQPSRFVEHMHQLFGDEPDAVFLEESWSVGVTAATENMHRRRRLAARADQHVAYQDRAIRELERMMALSGAVETFLADRSQPIERRYSPAWMQVAQLGLESAEQSSIDYGADAAEFEMSVERANALLGVAASAAREEVRTAYRRKVSACHPDRTNGAPEGMRRLATRQLSELNEAYRVVCEHMLSQAA